MFFFGGGIVTFFFSVCLFPTIFMNQQTEIHKNHQILAKNTYFFATWNFFLFPPPKQKTNTQKKGELFSFFKIFTAKFSHFLVTKLCNENFEK